MNRHLYYLTQCASTNDSIVDFAQSMSPGQIIGLHAGYQSGGRGQYGCQWVTPPNTNLTLSIALPAVMIQQSTTIFNYYTASLIREFLANLTKKEVSIKWPNDLIIQHKKVAGLLLESKKIKTNLYYIIGLGINVLQQNFEHLPKGGSLLTQTGITIGPKVLAEEIFEFLADRLPQCPAAWDVCEEYNRHLYLRDKVACFEIGEERQNGIIQEADAEGFLWVQLERDGLRKFYHKEIALLY